MRYRIFLFRAVSCLIVLGAAFCQEEGAAEGLQRTARASELSKRQLVYLVSDVRIPFWGIMWHGIRDQAAGLSYEVQLYSAENSAKRELEYAVMAIQRRVDGIIVSPTNSSACVTVLKLAREAGIPVVIADIGTDSGEYVSYISSDNRNGAYQIGVLLAEEMMERGWRNGTVGIVAIPQTRENGKARTAGFMKAMTEAGIRGAGIKQQVDFSYQETYRFSSELIQQSPNLRAIWLQGSNQYQAALDAIVDAGKKGEVILVTFDAEPEFLELIPLGILAGAAMQQPYLMGETAVNVMLSHWRGESVKKLIQLPVLAVNAENIEEQRFLIRRNVLGIVPE
jgi:ribose transport system substrate-binding protein